MQALFDMVNVICAKIQLVSDWFWSFPCNLDWYAAIPVLGNFSLAIILLVGTGVFLPSNCGLCRCGVLGMGCGHCCGAAAPKTAFPR